MSSPRTPSPSSGRTRTWTSPATTSTKPVSIPFAHSRARSASLSSTSSSSSAGSPDEIPTPVSSSLRGASGLPVTPGTSPIYSYFLGGATSPSKGLGSLTRGLGVGPVVFEEENEEECKPLPVAAHARRASTAAAGRFSNPAPSMPPTSPSSERGAGLLRRLSLSSSTFSRPAADTTTPLSTSREGPVNPPNTAVASSNETLPFGRNASGLPPTTVTPGRKPRRSATISGTRRVPSPMGERILKGHFDGFN